MNLSLFVRGTVVLAYLFLLAALLFIILIRRGVPRYAAFETVEISAGIFFVGLLVSYRIADRMALNGADSLLIYLPPVVPVAIFVLWMLPRQKRIK